MKLSCRLLLSSLVLALPFAASAQLTPFEVSVGWGQSGSFTRDSGVRGKLEGPVFSVSQSFADLPFVGEVRIGLSAFLGGQLSHGSDTDGNVYRVFGRYKTPTIAKNLYGIVGANYSWGKGRGGSFGEVSRIGGDIGVGMPIGPSAAALPRASLEFLSHQSARSQLRGWSLNLSLRL